MICFALWTLTALAQTAAPGDEDAPDSSAESVATEASAPSAPEPAASERAPSGQAPSEKVEGTLGSGPVVVYGQIDGEINLASSAFVTRLLGEARERDADLLLIELNTFGGRVDAAVAIRDALLDAPHEVAVFINKRAISAGALISFACNTIAISPGGTIGAAMPVSSNPGAETPAAVQEKYLSYFREEMRVTAEARGRNPDIAEAMVDADKEIEGVSEEGKILTLGTDKALELGMADFKASSLDEVLAELDLSASSLQKVDRSWSENLAAFLNSQAIASLLLLGMMLFGYLEIQTPGFGFFGAAAAICFMLLYFGHYLTNLAGHEELLLFAVGVVLIAVELLVLPGTGIFAALGAASILSSAVMVLSAGDWSDLITLSNPFTVEAMQQVALTMVLSAVSAVILFRFMAPATGGSTRGGLLLQESLATAEGYSSHELEEEADLVGQTGETLSELRPSGKARIDGRRLNVETEGDWIDRGESVVVTRQTEGRLVVRRA
ncbi:MAG: NfeD family protein [Acidobacteriota bacterium]